VPFLISARGQAFSRGRAGAPTSITFLQLFARSQARSHGRTGNPPIILTPFVPSQNVLKIGFPQRGYPLVNADTGLVNETWYRFFQTMWLNGGGTIGK
jgi:hypothetical protein